MVRQIEKCEALVEDPEDEQEFVKCGAEAIEQCVHCTKWLCPDCTLFCRSCRDRCEHYVYCGDCIFTHEEERESEF